MQRHLALVEDDDVIRANYVDLLSQAGFTVTAYPGKQEALCGLTTSALPDLVLLDITMGRERDAGFELCAELRRRSPALPIIFLTSHDGDIDKISGLRLGADDYITKDTSIDYLIVRIEALFRRRAALLSASSMHQRPAAPAQHSLQINEELSTVCWRGKRVALTLTQFWILRELTFQPGRVLSHSDLMRAAKIVVEPNTITAHIKAIRDSIRELDSEFDGIRTERGRGYRWVTS